MRALSFVLGVVVVVVVGVVGTIYLQSCEEPQDLRVIYIDGWRCLEASSGEAICEKAPNLPESALPGGARHQLYEVAL